MRIFFKPFFSRYDFFILVSTPKFSYKINFYAIYFCYSCCGEIWKTVSYLYIRFFNNTTRHYIHSNHLILAQISFSGTIYHIEMDFLSGFYRKCKLGVAGLGVAGSVTMIIIGAVISHGAAIPLIIGGSIWLTNSGFVLFDGIAANSLIKKDVDRLKKTTADFENENLNLKHNVEGLEKTKNKIEKQNNRLQSSIDKAANQILSLTNLKTRYEKNLEANEQNVENLETEVAKLDHLKYELTQNLQDLSKSLEGAESELKVMNELKSQYTEENKKLQESNKENKATINVLKSQVTKLNKLYDGTKALLANLATAGDVFTEFGSTIGDTSKELNETKEGYDDTLDKMNELLDRMKNSSFDDIDADDDGIITEKEFLNFNK